MYISRGRVFWSSETNQKAKWTNLAVFVQQKCLGPVTIFQYQQRSAHCDNFIWSIYCLLGASPKVQTVLFAPITRVECHLASFIQETSPVLCNTANLTFRSTPPVEELPQCELAQIYQSMQLILEQSRQSQDSHRLVNPFKDVLIIQHNTAVNVNPVSGELLVNCSDCWDCADPLKHAVMVAIDNVCSFHCQH